MSEKIGTIIALEGIDGSGKTTAILKVEEYLKEQGFDVLTLREPGGSVACMKIRSILLEHQLDPLAEAMLFAASRRQLISEKIGPALMQGKVVLMDRYIASSYVYQHGVIEFVDDFHHCHIPNGCLRHTAFLLDVSPEVAERRLMARDEDRNHFDDGAIAVKTERARLYRETFNAGRFNSTYHDDDGEDRAWIVPANGTAEETVELIINILDSSFIPSHQYLIKE